MKKLIAIGKYVDGKTHEFDCSDGTLYCYNMGLTELTIPEGVTHVYCSYNQLTELNVPEGVTHVYCERNQLTELKLPIGVELVNCRGNKITHLDLPNSVKVLWCEKEVAGLERYVGKVKMKLF